MILRCSHGAAVLKVGGLTGYRVESAGQGARESLGHVAAQRLCIRSLQAGTRPRCTQHAVESMQGADGKLGQGGSCGSGELRAWFGPALRGYELTSLPIRSIKNELWRDNECVNICGRLHVNSRRDRLIILSRSNRERTGIMNTPVSTCVPWRHGWAQAF